jgi:hypothetical protein
VIGANGAPGQACFGARRLVGAEATGARSGPADLTHSNKRAWNPVVAGRPGATVGLRRGVGARRGVEAGTRAVDPSCILP